MFDDDDSGGSITIADASANMITFDAEQKKLTITSSGDLQISSQGNLTVQAGQNLTLKAPQGQVEIQGMSGVKAESDGGMVEIKGVLINLN
jgi:uncharacterized protein (DUF2345 family)